MPWSRALSAFLLLGTITLVHAQAPALPIPKGTNVLFGRVLDVGTDAPIVGAVVSLIGYFESSGRPAASLPSYGGSPPASAPRSVMTTADIFKRP